jgi:hypothetical protein
MSEPKARDFWIVEDDFGEWHVFNTPIDLGHNNLTHVREVLPDDELDKLRAENKKLREAAAVLGNAAKLVYGDYELINHKTARVSASVITKVDYALTRYEEIMMKGGE